MPNENHRRIAEFISGEVRRAAYRPQRLDGRGGVSNSEDSVADRDGDLRLELDPGHSGVVLVRIWDDLIGTGASASGRALEVLDVAEDFARDLGGSRRFSLRVSRPGGGGRARISFVVDGAARSDRLAIVRVPIGSLIGPRVLDWTMALMTEPSPGLDSSGVGSGPLAEHRLEVDQEVLVRLDGVVYLLRGNPLEAVRRVEGPAFRPSSSPPPSSITDEADLTALDGDDDFCEIPLWPVENSDEPIVVTLVHRSARLDLTAHRLSSLDSLSTGLSIPLEAMAASLSPYSPDRMDEASDRLCAIDERTGLIVLEVGARWSRCIIPSRRPESMVLPMSSGSNVLPGMHTQIVARPTNAPFRPRRLVIGGTPSNWVVHDVRIGHRSQFAQSGDLPGEMFATTSIDSFVVFDVAQAATDVALVVSYVGGDPGGAPFVGALIGETGLAAGRQTQSLVRRSAMRWTPEGRLQGWMIGLTGEDENRDLDPTNPVPRPESPTAPSANLAESTVSLSPSDLAIDAGHVTISGPPDRPDRTSGRVDGDSTEASAMITSGS